MRFINPNSALRDRSLGLLLIAHAQIYGLLFAVSSAAERDDVAMASLVLAIGLVTASAVDMRWHIIPDEASLGLVLAGLASTWWFAPETIGSHAATALAWFCSLALVSEVYFRVRGVDGLGLGDAKLMAAAGAWLGAHGTPSVLLIASFGALGAACIPLLLRGQFAAGFRNSGLAFGPFIAVAVWITWLYGPAV